MTDPANWRAAFGSGGVAVYDEVLVPAMFEPWGEHLLEQVGATRGHAVLDVACGPGSVTRLAAARAGPEGRVTGSDLNAAMLDLARTKPPVSGGAPVEYVEGPAEAQSVADADYDIVLCQQGLQFFPDRPAALQEMRRVLRPGGRVAISVWCSIEECPPFAAVADGLAAALGADVAAAYRAGPWGWSGGAKIQAVMEAAGFGGAEVTRHVLPLVIEGGAPMLVATLGVSGVATVVAELDDSAHRELAEAIGSAVAPLTDGSAVRSEMASNVAIAIA